MKKTRLLRLAMLAVLPLAACGGTENIPTEEAVEKALPTLMKATVDTYGESECLTVNAKLNSFALDVTYGDYKVNVPISGEATFAMRNMYTTDASQLQAAALLKDINVAVNYQMGEGEDNKGNFELKNFDFGAYLSGGNLYLDLSDENIKGHLVSLLAGIKIAGKEVGEFLASTLLGDCKYKVENVVTNDKLPLVKKEDLTEDFIATKLHDIFGLMSEEDLVKVMSLVHDKGNDTYDLKFTVTDPDIVNRTYNNNVDDQYEVAKCDAVNMNVEAWTNNKGVFTGMKVNGSITLSGEYEEQEVKVALNLDSELTLNFEEYAVKNPAFSEFKTPTLLIEWVERNMDSLLPLLSGLSDFTGLIGGDTGADGE